MNDGTPIAWLGLGAMGRPMAARLAGAGYRLTVWNRTASRAEELIAAGARRAATPREAVTGARVSFLMLSDATAIGAVLGGDDGVLRGAAPGTVVVNTSTIGPSQARGFAAQCASAGLRYVDAPVLGSIGQATSGTLVALVAGDAAAIADVSSVLLTVARQLVRAGDVGQGSALKLVMNLLVGGITELLAESVTLAERSGLSRDVFRETLMGSVLASPFVGYKGPQLLERDYAPLFALHLMVKDLDLVLAAAQDLRLRLSATSAVRDVFARAVQAGLGEKDMAAVREVVGS